jgi:CRISPR/Cas system-associated exonuclease Cas4 (RecB family)
MIDLTQGEITRREFENCHYYFVDGDYYPGVTSILDEAAPTGYGLKQFFLNHTAADAEEIRSESASFGSEMHRLYEELLNGVELDLKARDLKSVKHLISFKEWYKEFKPHDFKTEMMVYSKKYKYAGTLDFVGTHMGKRWLVDFKTSSGIHFNHEIQLVAYKRAYEEMTGETIDHMGILRTGTKHKAGYEFKEIDRNFNDFFCVYCTFVALHGGKYPSLPVDLLKKHPDKIKL